MSVNVGGGVVKIFYRHARIQRLFRHTFIQNLLDNTANRKGIRDGMVFNQQGS